MATKLLFAPGRVWIGGGDMRAELSARGVAAEGETDLAAADRPQAVRDAFDVYRAAGAEVLLTQTSVLNSAYLKWSGEPVPLDRLHHVNQQAAAVARSAVADAERSGSLILGVIGPPGGLLSLEEVTPDDLRAAYTQQAAALRAGGVDALALLGLTELETLLVALEATVSTPVAPVVAGMIFGCGGDFDETTMGATLAAAIAALAPHTLAAFIIDPGESPDAAPDLVKAAAALTQIPIGVCIRAGHPVFAEGRLTYSDTNVDFSARLQPLAAAGARLVLAGPGAGPEHVAALVAARKRLKITDRR